MFPIKKDVYEMCKNPKLGCTFPPFHPAPLACHVLEIILFTKFQGGGAFFAREAGGDKTQLFPPAPQRVAVIS